jgi:polysaccharide pyruvyl transferase CsaB
MGNLGDEAILTALLNVLNKDRRVDITIVSRNPRQVQTIHGVEAIHEKGKMGRLQLMWALQRCELFLLGGGGLIKDYGEDSKSIVNWLNPLQMATKKKPRTKIALVAVGVENIRYKRSKKAVLEALSGVDMITVRDRHSKKILENLGVEKDIEVVSDPAILLCQTRKGKRALKARPRVLVCVRHWFDKGNYISNVEKNRRMLDTLSRAVDCLIQNYDADVDFYPLRISSPDDDRIVANQIVKNMRFQARAKIHISVPDVDEFIRMMDRYSLVIGMRLHSIILAAASGIPTIGLNYMPKVAAFMESIQQEQYLIDLETINLEKLKNAINHIFESHKEISKTILSKISVLQKVTEDSINRILRLAF